MREIKFKGIIKDTNEFVEVLGFDFENEIVHIRDENGLCDWCEMELINLLQYKNLKDANKKEIYEGAILENQCGNIVISEFNCFRFINGEIDESFNPELSVVVGNVYQNKELLK